MKNLKLPGFVFLCLIGLLFACKDPVPDVSDVRLNMQFHRLDLQLSNAAAKGTDEVAAVLDTYPDFKEIYTYQLLDLRVFPESIPSGIREFLLETDIQNLQDSVKLEFSDISGETAAIEQAFRFYAYYFPDRVIPDVVFFLFGFNYAMIPLEERLYVALDQYLGDGSPFLGHLPDYIRSRRRREYLPVDALKAWMTVDFDTMFVRNTLGDQMIFSGKIHYLLKRCFPGGPDSLQFGFKQSQIEFCELNEYKIWTSLLEADVMGGNDFRVMEKYLGEAPFTPGMPREVPGRVAEWIGWRIVESYTEKFKIGPDSLMKTPDQQILMRSGYRPKKK